MGLSAFIKGIYNALILSDNIRLASQSPAAGLVGTTVTCGKAAYGAWAQIAAAAVVTDPCWITGVTVDTPAAQTGATIADTILIYDIQLGSGGAGVEVGKVNCRYYWQHANVTAVGEYSLMLGSIFVARPVRLNAAPRIAARGASTDAANTQDIGVTMMLGTVLGG